MAIDTIKSWQEFTSDGTTAYFAFNFNYDFNRPEDIMVGIRTGDNTYTVIAPEHYELTPNASEDGGQIRFIQAIQNPIGIEIIDKIPAAGEIIRIERKSSQTSSATWQIGLDMTTLVNLFDRLFRLTQENKGRFDNTIKTFATQHNIKLFELLAEHNNTLLFWDDENKTLTPTEFPKKDIVRAKDGLFFRITADERSNVYLEWSENGITNWHSMNFGKIEETAEEAKEIAQEAKAIAETADNKSTSAIQTANEAKSAADTALSKSLEAIEHSNAALANSEWAVAAAGRAEAKANSALSASERAEANSEMAVATSERAEQKAGAAEQAVQEYDVRIQQAEDDAASALSQVENKQDILVSGTNIKTLNNESLLGSGNIDITSAQWGNITGDLADQEDLSDALDTINDRIDNVEARGRFLALWNAATGLPESIPQITPYTYKTGDYYIVGTVGETNYRPSGSEFVEGRPSTEIETEELTTDDVYYYDGAVWRLQVNHGKTVSFANLAGQPEDNTALKNALDAKQPVGNYATTTALTQGLATKQNTLVSGTNIKTLNNQSILGSGNIEITSASAQWGKITGTLSNQTDLKNELDSKTAVIIRRW